MTRRHVPSENVESMAMTKKKNLNSRKLSSIYKSCVSEVARCESEADELNDTFNVLGTSHS